MSNKSMGSKFESEFCELLFRNGFWVHNLAQNQAGQPADIIAVKNYKPFLIDCKVCSNDEFPSSRVEENQKNAMSLWRESGNGDGWFALLTSEGIYMLPHPLIGLRKTWKLLDITQLAVPLGRWLRICL